VSSASTWDYKDLEYITNPAGFPPSFFFLRFIFLPKDNMLKQSSLWLVTVMLEVGYPLLQ
ncbi:mCG145906, partial [Mus musculus]